MERYLCIHGHFYQPPRENPWLDEIEIQETARPHRNWNERISAECYRANAFARILNPQKQIVDIVNNYSKISFNFGPTLLSWLEKYDSLTYKALLEADKKSQELFGGHGSAIAQVYNHIILPLANDKDKETQIIWGIADFEKRFNRKPEGMWLAETAVDTTTLELLAKHGIKFTILAPSQCLRTRKIGTQNWQEENYAKVDPKKPYLCNLPSGNKIALFFYDGPISQGIAFGDTLKSGERFAARLLSAFDTRREPQLVHIATDGETYGHHQKFADMALAYCLNYIERNNLATLTVYGQYLEMFPPTFEAQIRENTSWSCAHGIERWRSNCGCNSGMHRPWQQLWRAPLRKALDSVRDKLLITFENLGKEYFKDPYEARNDYISVILDHSKIEEFLKTHATQKGLENKPAALKLMEMQRNAMLMYTSCGWFFDEISGIETVQIMAYAKRAIGYNKGLTGEDLQNGFIEQLALAPSNIPLFKDGAKVYKDLVMPISRGLRKAAIDYAISYLLDEILFEDRIYIYNIEDNKIDVLHQEHIKLICGSAVFVNRLTTEKRLVSFAVLHQGGPDITAGAIYGQTDNLEQLKELFSYGEYAQCVALIKGSFVDTLTIKDLPKEKQIKLLANVVDKAKKRIRTNYINLFKQEKTVLEYIKNIDLPMPRLFLDLAEFVLNYELREELTKDTIDNAKISQIITDLKQTSAELNIEDIKKILTKKLVTYTKLLEQDPQNLESVNKIIDLLNFANMFNLPLDLYCTQNTVFRLKKEGLLGDGELVKILLSKLNLNLM